MTNELKEKGEFPIGYSKNEIANSIIVWKMDFSLLNKSITELILATDPPPDYASSKKFCIDPIYTGTIFVNGKYMVVSNNAVYRAATPVSSIDLRSQVLKINIPVMYDTTGVVQVRPYKMLLIDIEKINECKTGESFSLPEFMGNNYRLNERMKDNETKLLENLFNIEFEK